MTREEYIRSLYQTYLGREPDAGGLAFYSNPAFSDALIAADIQKSAEAFQNTLQSKVQEVLANSQAGYNPEMAYTPVGQFQLNGKTYTVNPDGSYYALEELGGGNIATQVYDPSGNLTNDFTYNRNESTYLTPVVNALMAAAGAAVLGPAGTNLLSTPAAAAVGSGGTSLLRGGSVEDALKSAALAALAAYGGEALFGGGGVNIPTGEQAALELTIADDISQLARSGLSPDQIASVVSTSYGIDPFAAAESVSSVLGAAATSPATVNVLGSTLPSTANVAAGLGTLAGTVPSLGAGTSPVQTVDITGTSGTSPAAGLLGSIAGVLPTTGAPTQTVSVTGTPSSTSNINAGLLGSLAGVLPTIGAPTQTVTVEGTQPSITPVVPPVVSNLFSRPSPVSPTIPQTVTIAETPIIDPEKPSVTPVITTVPTQSVTVTDTGYSDTGITPVVVTSPVTPTAPTQSVDVTDTRVVDPEKPTPPVVVTSTTTPPGPDTTTTTSTDGKGPDLTTLLSLLTLLGGAGVVGGTGGTGTTTTTLPPSDTNIASTTPTYGSDYYNAIQRYYNAYMPQYPRNVATPLQQWYENKFGA